MLDSKVIMKCTVKLHRMTSLCSYGHDLCSPFLNMRHFVALAHNDYNINRSHRPFKSPLVQVPRIDTDGCGEGRSQMVFSVITHGPLSGVYE